MKILLLGSGGREHALAWKIAQSPKVEKLYIAPGNAGTTAVGENVNIKATDFEAISAFALKENIQMVVVGPEDPLVEGIYDYFQNRPELKHIAVIGPSAQGAELEGSKEFAKGFMMRHNIPTARYKSITSANLEEGLAFLETLEAPYVSMMRVRTFSINTSSANGTGVTLPIPPVFSPLSPSPMRL